MDFEKIAQELCNQGALFVDNLQRARNISCVQGHFSSFLGSKALEEAKQAITKYPEKKTKMIQSFRKGIGEIYTISKAWDHALNKPFGYPGDFAALELVYDQAAHPASNSAFATLLDQWAASTNLARAVRARKDALRVFLEEDLLQHSRQNTDSERLSMLSIASGGAREIREMNSDLFDRLEISLLDQDPRALDYSTSCLNARSSRPKINKILANIFKLDPSEYLSNNQRFDLIYSFGLFDYLSDEQILSCTHRFLPYLKSDGKFIFCLKDTRFFDAWFYDWCFDWKFVPRIDEDGESLIQKMGLNLINRLKIEGNTVCIYICQKTTEN